MNTQLADLMSTFFSEDKELFLIQSHFGKYSDLFVCNRQKTKENKKWVRARIHLDPYVISENRQCTTPGERENSKQTLETPFP